MDGEVQTAGGPARAALVAVLGPVVDWRTYASAGYLLATFPLGLAYFIVLVVALTFGGAMIWTILGPPVLLATLYLSRWAGDGEAWMVRHVQGISLRRPPTTIERGSYRAQVRDRLTDPTTWTGLLYLFVQFPVGIVAFVILVTLTSLAGLLLAGPFVAPIWAVTINIGSDERTIDSLAEVWWWPLGGLAVLLLEVHVVRWGARAHASWARMMLGSGRRTSCPVRRWMTSTVSSPSRAPPGRGAGRGWASSRPRRKQARRALESGPWRRCARRARAWRSWRPRRW